MSEAVMFRQDEWLSFLSVAKQNKNTEPGLQTACFLRGLNMQQHTLAQTVEINGIGLHSGLPSKLVLHPAEANTGIVFVRSDLPSKPSFKALYSQVVDTRNCTCLGDADKNVVSTIEHLMSVLYILGIDNVRIEVSNPELPILDGSAEKLYQTLKKIPLVEQNAPRKYLKVLKNIVFTDNNGNSVSLSPTDDVLKINFTIEFPSPIVGHQEFHGSITENLFVSEIAPCRTFCEKSQIDYLQSIGLIKGGSLENALVLDGDKVLNPDGMKNPHECVNHKVLDAIGDMYTSGFFIIGELTAMKTGHFHNNELLKKLFSDNSNYKLV